MCSDVYVDPDAGEIEVGDTVRLTWDSVYSDGEVVERGEVVSIGSNGDAYLDLDMEDRDNDHRVTIRHGWRAKHVLGIVETVIPDDPDSPGAPTNTYRHIGNVTDIYVEWPYD
jgi:hypothetical protein